LKEDHLEGLSVDGNVILKRILKITRVVLDPSGSGYRRVGKFCEHWIEPWGSVKWRGISWPAVELLASQEALC